MTPTRPGQEGSAVLAGLTPADRLRLLSKAFEQSGEAILISDRDNRIVAVNQAFCALTGYSEAEVLGRNPQLLASGHTTEAEYAALWAALGGPGIWRGEMWDRRKDGTTYLKHVTIAVIHDDAGNATHYVANFADVSTRDAGTDRILHLAHHDALTGLLNRHALHGELQRTLAAAMRNQTKVAVLLIDLDRFKVINDSLGHQVGDQLLMEMARRLAESVRASDVIGRLGGDEFVVVLPDVENELSVAGIASKLRHHLSDIYRIADQSLYATPSIGITLFPADGKDPNTLIRNADTAMYHAKAAGRNNFKFFTPSMNARASERLRLETALRQALESTTLTTAQFHLCFQPQVHLGHGGIVAIEALARWQHPELGEVPPTRFIPVAEETGLIQALGDWVFWEACRRLRDFKDEGIAGIRMAVNLSAQQLRDEALLSIVRGALSCYDLRPEELEIEISEGAIMQSPTAMIAILRQLGELGLVVTMDDFGTGNSSLVHLRDLPVNRIKLDQTLLDDIAPGSKGAAICAAIITLGRDLGLELVAEAVETNAQREFVRALGCDAMQGFPFCRPLPAAEIAAFLKGSEMKRLPASGQ